MATTHYPETVHPAVRTVAGPAHNAQRILHVGYVALPLIAGADKFTNLLVQWEQYLAPTLAAASPLGASGTMMLVGVIEIVAALVVAINPRIGGYVVAAWLAGIIVNLFLLGGAYDVALRDFGLLLGALALSQLSERHRRSRRAVI